MKIIRFKIEDRVAETLRDFCKTNHISISDYVGDAVIQKLNIDKYGDMNLMKKQSESEKTKYSVDVKVNNDTIKENSKEKKEEENVTQKVEKDTEKIVLIKEPVKHKKRILNAK